MEYEVIRSRGRSVSIRISAEGKVIVRAPWFVSNTQIKEFVESHSAWIEKRQKSPMNTPVDAETEKQLRKKAREVMTEYVKKYSEIMGVRPTSVKITSARTRFGSCSAKNAVSFSWRLMLYPDEAAEYVAVHELAHIRHKNHGKEFWAFVEQTLPHYKKARALLK